MRKRERRTATVMLEAILVTWYWPVLVSCISTGLGHVCTGSKAVPPESQLTYINIGGEAMRMSEYSKDTKTLDTPLMRTKYAWMSGVRPCFFNGSTNPSSRVVVQYKREFLLDILEWKNGMLCFVHKLHLYQKTIDLLIDNFNNYIYIDDF